MPQIFEGCKSFKRGPIKVIMWFFTLYSLAMNMRDLLGGLDLFQIHGGVLIVKGKRRLRGGLDCILARAQSVEMDLC